MGTYDLKDNSLITLKEASMEEVRRRNEPKLVAKATLLRDLVIKLNNQNKTVVVSTLITLELVGFSIASTLSSEKNLKATLLTGTQSSEICEIGTIVFKDISNVIIFGNLTQRQQLV